MYDLSSMSIWRFIWSTGLRSRNTSRWLSGDEGDFVIHKLVIPPDRGRDLAPYIQSFDISQTNGHHIATGECSRMCLHLSNLPPCRINGWGLNCWRHAFLKTKRYNLAHARLVVWIRVQPILLSGCVGAHVCIYTDVPSSDLIKIHLWNTEWVN